MSSGPLRPSLHRGNISTNSVPQIDLREKPLARSALGMSPYAASALSPPNTQSKKLMMGQDMMRTESADSHRLLKSKHSRKELRELARSASPLVTNPPPPATSYSSSKHKYSRSWDDDNDDARSVSSFTCAFADEFDAKLKSRLEYGDEEGSNRQRFLDAVFRKLTQKTGIHKRESRAWAAVDKTIREEQNRKASSNKVKPHFLDLSTYISPIPTSTTADASDSVTPRPSDFSRFTSVTVSPEQAAASKQRPILRSRRSAETLGESRRLQREEWSAVALNSARGAATAESVGSFSLGLSVGQIVPPGMSHALLARSYSSSPAPAPVPSLPDWARNNNRSLHQQNRSVDLIRNATQDGHGPAYRPVDMSRAVSHDAGGTYSRSSRPTYSSEPYRGASGPLQGLPRPMDQQYRNPPPAVQVRSQQRIARSVASPMTSISPQWPRGGQPLPEECASPIGNTPPSLLYRISTSSAASDSGASSGISSVPQTPISRTIALSSVVYPLDYSHGDEMEMTADDEEHLLSGMGQFALEKSNRNDGYDRYARLPLSVTPRPQKNSTQVVTLMEASQHISMTPNRSRPMASSHYKSSSSGSMAMLEEEEEHLTVKANRIQMRPRASTTSSMHSPTRSRTSPECITSSSPQSPSRTSSLQKNRTAATTRDSIASSLSRSTSSSSMASHSESLLSYTRGSPTSSCGSPSGSPSSNSKNQQQRNLVPNRKRTTSKAEDWASTIGRRFAKGVLKGNPDEANPMPHQLSNNTTLEV